MTETIAIDLQRAARTAEQAAYAAGTHLQASRARLTEAVITQRSQGEVLADIHREAQRLICDVVFKHFPSHALIAPGDAADAAELRASGQPHWVIDPLDGGANYLRGYPQYAVSLALVEAGVPRLGVVYDPCRNEFFGAIEGRGAVLNGDPITCAKPRPTAESLAATVFPKAASACMPVYMAELGRVLRAFNGVRRSGSIALEFAYLAAGRIDGLWAHDTVDSRAAAGLCLLRGSGALMHARDGLALLSSRSLLACTPALFEPFLSLLAEA
jgi:myo-inositol-1(or 4)-monophosphatase